MNTTLGGANLHPGVNLLPGANCAHEHGSIAFENGYWFKTFFSLIMLSRVHVHNLHREDMIKSGSVLPLVTLISCT